MRRMHLKPIAAVLALLLLFAWTFSVAKEDPAQAGAKSGVSLAKTAGTPNFQILNINNFTTWQNANGNSNNPPSLNGNGGYYPRGTKNVIYEDGFVWGGKMFTNSTYTTPAASQPIRVGGGTYNTGTRQGWIKADGKRVDVADPLARIFRIRRDYTVMSDNDKQLDAKETNELATTADVTQSQIDAIMAQYKKDWDEWPVSLGAPYIERNGQAGYQKPPAFSETFTVDDLIKGKYDEPGVAGVDPNSPADQVVWTVFNDLDAGVSQSFEGSDPIGIEAQVTIWGYKRSDALGSIYFKRIRLLNKGRDTGEKFWVDSMYVAQWSDPDNGDSGDDLCGCDTTTDAAGRKSLAYVYNGNAIDLEFAKFGLPAPAIGYEFLGGPLVAAPGDSGVFDLKRVYNKKNLGMSSFSWFAAGAAISDPPFTYEGALRWWKMLNGYVPNASSGTWDFYPAPPGTPPTKYPLAGDPVTRRGSIDGLGTSYSFAPGDRRINATTGPFRFAPGDTKEVVVGTVAGIGADRLSGVSVMKFNDQFVRFTYKAIFAVPKAPARPKVNVAELDKEVILDWGSDAAGIAATEQTVNQPGQYEFEGYNVYQFPSVSSSIADAKRIVTFDLTTDPTVVVDFAFDASSGLILQKPVQFGSNSGISRKFSLKKDYVKDIPVLYNGYSYFVAITAYSVSKIGFLPASLESAPEILTVTPQTTKPGYRYGGAAGDTVKGVTQIVAPGGSTSQGSVTPIIVNPAALTGHKYRVSFNDVTDTVAHTTTTYWSLTDVTANKVMLSKQANQTGDDNYIVVDGMQVKVSGPRPGMGAWSIPSGTRRFSPVGGFTGLGLEGFSNAGDPTAYDQDNGTIGMAGHFAFGGIGTTLKVSDYKNVLLKLAVVNNTALWDPKATPSDTNYSRAYRYLRAAGNPPADPSFAPWIVNVGSGYPYQGYDYSAPFSAWNMETTPPTRLAVGTFENNVVGGLVDGRYWPPLTSTANSGPREFAFIFLSPYTTTANPALSVNLSNNATTPLMWVMVCNRRAEAAWVAGDQFLITANHVNTPANTFEFTAPANTVADPTLAKEDVGRISVYPNPYYAWNPAETNRLAKYVTFTKLPAVATIRIFNLAGQLVRVLEKNDNTQFMRWDLNNTDAFPVASGMYVIHVDMPTIGATKVLKLGVIQEQEVPNVY